MGSREVADVAENHLTSDTFFIHSQNVTWHPPFYSLAKCDMTPPFHSLMKCHMTPLSRRKAIKKGCQTGLTHYWGHERWQMQWDESNSSQSAIWHRFHSFAKCNMTPNRLDKNEWNSEYPCQMDEGEKCSKETQHRFGRGNPADTFMRGKRERGHWHFGMGDEWMSPMTPAKHKVKRNRKKEREATDPAEYDLPRNTESEWN